jgi:hypothetical protein
MKELKVLELHHQGYSYRKIASLVHLSLRDVTKYIHRISNKTKSPSTTSVMDEVVLEYRVAGLKCEVRDLKIERDDLMNKVKELYLFNKNDFLLKDSLDNIINVHKDLLPLIFGKWNLLKSVLKIVSVYVFDVIIDKDTRATIMNTSVVLGGNKEFYDGIHGIAEYSRRKLHKFHHIGMGVYQEFSKKGNIDKINEVYNKLSEISILLGYARSRNMSMPVNEAKVISIKTLFGSKTVGSILERAMVYEITALYLNQEFFSPLQFTAPIQFYVILQELPIKKRLFNLLNRSVELEQFFPGFQGIA